MMISVVTQIIYLVLLFCVDFLFGLLPLAILQASTKTGDEILNSQQNGVHSFLHHFGGGIFLSICLIVLLPESQEHLNGHFANDCSSSQEHTRVLPIPELIVLCGFFITFALQELSHHLLLHFVNGNASRDERVRFCSCAKRHTECNRTYKVEKQNQTMFGMEEKEIQKSIAATNTGSGISRPLEPAATADTNLLQHFILSTPIPNYGSVTHLSDPSSPQPSLILPTPIVYANNGSVAIIRRHQTPCRYVELTRSILTLVIISALTLLQGAKLGRSIQTSSWATFALMSSQQLLVVFVQGSVSTLTSKRWFSVLCLVIVPCVTSVTAASLTAFLDLEASGTIWDLTAAFLCGSLLYLTFCDIMRREVKISSGFKTFVCFTLGAAMILCLNYTQSIIK